MQLLPEPLKSDMWQGPVAAGHPDGLCEDSLAQAESEPVADLDGCPVNAFIATTLANKTLELRLASPKQ
jgi:hypothetical protein